MNSASNILLVDDNAIQGATRKAILERCGHVVSIAPNGAAAIEYLSFEELTRNLGMIITDHLMPEMNGPELVAEIRRRGISLPILVLSGLPDAGDAYEGLDVTFRLKPLHPESLIEVARQLRLQPVSRTA
jgi:CheY-like chemotaxis protein